MKSEIQHYHEMEKAEMAKWIDKVYKIPQSSLAVLVLSAEDLLTECLTGEDTPLQKEITEWHEKLLRIAIKS